MAVHFFHCTDGVDIILDRTGRETGPAGDVRLRARGVAQEIMRSLPTYDEWAGWAVHVYDERGEVEIVPFEPDHPVAYGAGAVATGACCPV